MNHFLDFASTFTTESAMQLIQSPVNTYAFNQCSSGGAALLAAGTGERAAFQGELIVIHGAKFRGRYAKEVKTGVQDYYTAFWKRRAKLPADWLPLPFEKCLYLTAEQAKEYGVVDKIITRKPSLAELMSGTNAPASDRK